MTAADPVTSFTTAAPVLSRGRADRDEDLREPARYSASWPTAQVLVVDRGGGVAVEWSGRTPSLVMLPAAEFGEIPPEDGVLLGSVTGDDGSRTDVWAIPGEVPDQVRSPSGAWGEPRPHKGGLGLRDLGALLSDTDAGLMTAAVAVLTWHRHAGFCPVCGQPNRSRSAGWSRVCPQAHEEFPRTDPAVIMLVHDGADQMVLARQPSWPPGRVSVLAGFVEAGESLETTVIREVGEEIGVPVTDVSYLGSQPWPFPRSLMVGFAARAQPQAPLAPRDGEIEEAFWVDRGIVREILRTGGKAHGLVIPPAISIARRMIEGWAAIGE